MNACEHEKITFAQWAIMKGANINARTDSGIFFQGFTLLFDTIHKRSTGKIGWTALHSAAKRDNVSIVNLLLEKGAEKDAKAAHP